MQTNDTSTITLEKKMPYAYPITSHVWTRGVLTPSFTSPHQFRYLNLHVVRKYSSENIFQTTVIRKFQLNATSINVSCSLCYLTKQDCAAHWSITARHAEDTDWSAAWIVFATLDKAWGRRTMRTDNNGFTFNLSRKRKNRFLACWQIEEKYPSYVREGVRCWADAFDS